MKIENFFANVDNKSECVPIASSLTSVVDIFIKVGLLFAKKETITKSCYYEHLASKSFKRCILLAIPIIGNITVGLYDKYKEVDWDNFNEALRAVKKDGTQLSQANNLLKKNTFIVEAAIENNPLALEHADENFRDNQTLINKIRDSAFENKKAALKFASAEQQLRLLREGFFTLDEVADEYKNNINFLVATYTLQPLQYQKETALNFIRINSAVFQYLDEPHRQDDDVMQACFESNHYWLSIMTREFQLNKVKEDGSNLQFVLKEYKDDNEFVDEAFTQNKNSLQYASKTQKLRKIDEDVVNFNYISSDQSVADLKEDRGAYIKAALKKDPEALKGFPQGVQLEAIQENWATLRHVSDDYKSVDEFVDQSFTHNKNSLGYASREQQLRLVKNDGRNLNYVSKEYKNDEEFVNEAFAQHTASLEYASRKQQLRLVKSDGQNFKYVFYLYKNDEEFIEEAVKSNKEAIAHASEYRKCELLQKNGLNLEHFFRKDQDNIILVQYAIQQNPESLKHATRNIQLYYVKENADNFKYIDPAYQGQEEFKEALENARQNNKN